jgi:hypothetical protein
MVNPFGEHLTTQTYWQNHVNITAHIKTSERIYPHRLRHSFATEMIRAGMKVPVLMKILGHETPRMTMHYVEVTHADLRQAYDQAQSHLKIIQAIPLPEPFLLEEINSASSQPMELLETFITRLESVRRDTSDPAQSELLHRFIKRMRRAKDDLGKFI